MSESTRELFERYHACWADHAPDRIVELHTPDSVFHLHSGREPARGREEIRAAAAETFALVPDLKFALVNLRVGEDFWVVQWNLTGTSITGAAVDVDLADVVFVENGAVKEKHSYVDGVAMQAAMSAPAEIA
ncbi:nuclear transport factor 2 family protein [Nocardia sp. 2]|uniref:Nuclear transport factor 2 family protein n=1 Tax=Nocardia acididurans TaxID=2802282 RepID=A0ABS1MGD1_9NOCA|nr:nuclear transport factor 2 family protein [Nocardia acididurans]MBL1079324.1 nuclear transport factor 2 family protein [Nocardia acididurans]